MIIFDHGRGCPALPHGDPLKGVTGPLVRLSAYIVADQKQGLHVVFGWLWPIFGLKIDQVDFEGQNRKTLRNVVFGNF